MMEFRDIRRYNLVYVRKLFRFETECIVELKLCLLNITKFLPSCSCLDCKALVIEDI